MRTTRINVRVPLDLNEKLRDWADRLGVTKSQLASMSIQAGFRHILGAVAPDQAIPPDVMAQVIMEMQKAGVDVKLPETD